MGIKEMINEYNFLCQNIQNQLISEIDRIEQNPNIKSLGGRCFSVSFAEISRSDRLILSADYYDFEQQKEYVKEILSSSKITFEKKLEKLKEISETQRYKSTRFHPDVLNKIQVLLEELE